MNFLRTLFVIVAVVLVMIFAFNNWTETSVRLWGNLLLITKLPVLLFLAFLLGLVPMLIVHRAAKWRWRRRIETQERSLADLRAPSPEAPAPPPSMPSAAPPSVA